MKRIFILIFTLLFAFSAFSACESANETGGVVSEPSYAQESSQISEIESSVAEESEEESEAEEIVIPEDTVINFLACPDNLVHHSMYYDAIERAAEKNGVKADYSDLHNATYDFSQIYTYIKPLIDKADISYINQESLTGGDSKDISAYPRFNTPVAMGETVADLGFDIVNVAHNHMLDSGNTDFLEYCSNLFISRGVHALGYYPTEESAEDILIIDEQGVKIAFLTYTYSTNGIKNKDESFVIPYFEEELIRKQMAIANEKADVIIVSCHWGNEYSYKPNSMQRENALLLCELGADVIVGMHPHCIQPMEWLTAENGNETLVTYSLGTMVSGIRKGMSTLAGLLSLDIVKDGETGDISFENVLFIPTVAHYERGRSVADNDSGSRGFTIYPLADYTEEMASKHSLVRAERLEGKTTLIGGGFSRETLIKTVTEYIPEEFLPDLNKGEE